MLVVVNQPHTENDFKMFGSISKDVVAKLIKEFGGHISIISDENIDVHDLVEYQEFLATCTPGKNLNYYRKLNGFNQKQLAEKLGISVQNLSNMEHDRRAISKNMAKKLSTVLEAPVSRFL